MLDLAIICSSFPARENLLERSLETWERSIDHSELECCSYVYHNGYKPLFPELWSGYYNHHFDFNLSGSHITGYNYWLERIEAKVYIFTHPDLLFPLETVRTAYDIASKDDVAAMFKVFWMPQQMTENIDAYEWLHPETLEKEVALYPMFHDNHGDFYWNKDVRSKTEWHSTTTWAINHNTLQKLKPFPDFGKQGPDDPYFYAARSRLMIEDVCVMNPILFHQWHPQTWSGDSQEAVKLAQQEITRRFE